MKQKRLVLAIAVFLGVLLVALPALPGCGGGGGGEPVIKIGVLADFTGTAAFAMQPTMQAMEDYLRVVLPEKDPLPGVRVEFTHFNTELDYSKSIPGYLALKGRGVDMMVIPNAQDRELIGDRLAQDKIPVLSSQGLASMLDSEWSVCSVSPVQSQGEVEMRFIMDNWDGEGSPKVGHLGFSLESSDYHQEGIQSVLDEYPDQFTWVGFERGTIGKVTWASEVGRLKDCDYIIMSVAGPMLSSFVSQARAAGYTGAFITGMEGFPGFWDLVTDAMKGSPEQLYDCYYVAWWPWWNEEDVPLIQDCKEYVDTYHADEADELMRSSSVISGWSLGLVLEAAIRGAVEAVGAENVDGVALKNAIREMDMEVEGYADRWHVTETNNCLSWSQRVFEWNISENAWFPQDTVYVPELTKPAE